MFKGNYAEIINSVSKQLAEEILFSESDLSEQALLLDGDIAGILRQIGLETTKLVYKETLSRVVSEKKKDGLEIKKNPLIEFNVIFGKLELNSPYLWLRGEASKPLTDKMGITHEGRSETVNRALSDFGSEESFANASKRFEEHYKYNLSSSAVGRVTKQIAREAEVFIEERLNNASYVDKDNPVKELLVELDGCEIRTAELFLKENTKETTPIRKNPKKVKIINWRDVRIGLLRPLGTSIKTYIGKKDFYPVVVKQLFNASLLTGMSPYTDVIAVADGGIGLKEEIENQFSNVQFILDKTHLKDHFYETAEALGIVKDKRSEWVKLYLDGISNGEVSQVKKELEEEYSRSNNNSLKRLIGYINRFYNSMNYNEFKLKGYPIGSGEIESAHKSVPQKRMKIPGASWHPNTINPMLSLRVLRANNWWEEFWEKRNQNHELQNNTLNQQNSPTKAFNIILKKVKKEAA